jgi:hypothetical protein
MLIHIATGFMAQVFRIFFLGDGGVFFWSQVTAAGDGFFSALGIIRNHHFFHCKNWATDD